AAVSLVPLHIGLTLGVATVAASRSAAEMRTVPLKMSPHQFLEWERDARFTVPVMHLRRAGSRARTAASRWRVGMPVSASANTGNRLVQSLPRRLKRRILPPLLTTCRR